MAVNALPPAPAPANGPTVASGDRKGDEAAQDPTFAALLATMLGPMAANPIMAMIPGQPAPETASGTTPPAAAPAVPGVQAPVTAALAQLAGAAEVLPQPAQAAQVPQNAQLTPVAQQTGQSPNTSAVQAASAFDAVLAAVQPQASAPAAQQVVPAQQVVAVPPEPPAQPVDLAQVVADALKQAQIAAAQPAVTATAARTEQPVVAKVDSDAKAPAKAASLPGPVPEEAAVLQPAATSVAVPAAQPVSAAKENPADAHQPQTKPAPRAEAPVVNAPVFQPPVVHVEQQKPETLKDLPNPIDPTRLMDVLAQSISSAKPGHYTVTLQLYPDSLGEVRMQVQVTGREVHTTMQVTNPASQKVLEDRGDLLRQALGQSGLTLSGFQVSTGAGNQSPQERRDRLNEQLAAQRRTGRVAAISAPARPEPGRPLGRNLTGGVLDTLA